jgi:hypothetical protein
LSVVAANRSVSVEDFSLSLFSRSISAQFVQHDPASLANDRRGHAGCEAQDRVGVEDVVDHVGT